MDLLHLFSLPLHANPCCLDPCININFVAVPITKNTVGVWTTSEIRSSISEKRLPSLPIELAGHCKEIRTLAFTNGSKHCLASSCSEKILLWDLSTIKEEQPKCHPFFSQPGALNVMCFNNNDSLIAAGKDYQVFLFEREQSTCKAVFEAHSAMVSGVKFCPHYSATLVSISDDRTVCIWDTEKSILLYQSAILTSSPLISLDMNLCEPHVAIGTADGNLRIFDLTDGHDFRQLVSLDVGSQVKKNNEKCSEGKFENKITPTIVSKKSKFSQKPDQQLIDPCVEASESLLHLEYTYSIQSHNSNLFPNIQGQFSGAGNLIDDIPTSLIVVSTNNIIHLNSRTLEIISITPFQHSMKSASFASSLMIGPLSYAASKQISPSQVVVVAGTLFDRKIHVFEQTLLNEKFQNLQPSVMKGEDTTLEYDDAKEDGHLNIVAIDAMLENSPLRAELLPPVRKSLTTKGDVATGKKKLASSMNQPLTFKSQVKSSGYTKAPRTTMFKPETSKSKLLGQENASKKKMSQVNTGAVKMLTNEYDITKGAVNQACNTFEVDSSTTAILNLQFSDDGSNLACALSNKTALSIKSPFSKHICTSFVGHNNQVNSVYWSNSGNYILTASNDKTVALWDKNGGDALMVLSYQKGTMKEKVDRQNNASSSMTTSSKSLTSSRSSSSGDNKCFSKDIKHAQFFYMDKFILLTHGNELSLFSFYVVPEIDDIKRYETRNRYKLVEKWQTQSSSFTTSAAVNKFYSHLVLCTTSGKTMEVYDLNKSVRSHIFSDCHTRPPHCVVINEGSGFSSQSSAAYNVIATAAPTDPIKLWDVRSKSCVQALSGHLNKSHACQLAFSPCGNYLASGSEDRCTYVFDLRKGTFCEKLRGHSEVVCSVAFHPAFPLLATGSLDSKVIWYKS